MKHVYHIFVLAIIVCGVTACIRHAGTPQPQPEGKPQPSPASADPVNPNQERNNYFAKQFFQQIEGREQEPAGTVFKNLQNEGLKKVSARQFLRIMNRGYSRALGVECTHCHVEQDFASDDKRPKRAAREMALLHRMINDQLSEMENLEENPKGHFINCSTCHHGAVIPG